MGVLSHEIATGEGGALPRAPGSYQTFSRKLAPALTAAGGALVVVGGLGSWVRATRTESEGVPSEQVVNVMGNDQTTGWLLAALGVAAILLSGLWLVSAARTQLVTAPLLTCIATVGFVAYRLKLVDRDAAALAADARTGAADFFSYHAGFGWGAWLLLAACVLLGLGAFVGVLRRLDLERGVPDQS